MNRVDTIIELYDELDEQEVQDVVNYVIRHLLPPGAKLRDIIRPGSSMALFDLDLANGQIAEVAFLDAATPGKMEVKRDYLVGQTDNVAVEFGYNGRPSGISITTAPWWLFWFDGPEFEAEAAVLIATERLRDIIDVSNFRVVSGGDDDASEMYLVPKAELLQPNTVIAYRERHWKHNG